MNELAEFLRARYAVQETPLREVVRQLDAHAASDDDVVGIDGGWTLWGSFGRAVDAAFQPRQMLRDIEAKRKLVDAVMAWEHKLLYSGYDGNNGPYPCTWEGVECDPDMCGVVEKQRQVLGALVAEFASHPDYREEWRP